MQLYKYIFASIFGGKGRHAVRLASIRGLSMVTVSALLGTVIAGNIPSLPADSQNMMFTVCVTLLFVQLVALLAYASSFSILRPNNHEHVGRLLISLPLQAHRLWISLVLPGLFLGVIVLAFTMPILLRLCIPSNWWVVFVGAITGLAGALGLVYGVSRRYGYIQVVAVPLYYFAEYRLVTLMHSVTGSLDQLLTVALFLMNILAIFLLFKSRKLILTDIAQACLHKRVWLLSLPTGWWFAKKLLRSLATRTSLLTAFLISLCLALILWHMRVMDPILLSGAAAFLIAAFCSDIRATSRRLYPAESIMIRGTPHFFIAQLGWSLCFSSIIISPLAVLQVFDSVSFSAIKELFIMLLLGMSAGLFAGTWIAPKARDMTAQVCANLLALGLVIIPLTTTRPLIMYLAEPVIRASIAAVLLLLGLIIELHRNNYIWGKRHAT